MLLQRILVRLQRLIFDRPIPVLVASGLLVVLGLVAAFGVEFRTSRSELAFADDPDQAKLDRLLREAGGARVIVACVEHDNPADGDAGALRSFADRLAKELALDPLVGGTFHRIPLDWFLDRALYLAPPERLDEALSGLENGAAGNPWDVGSIADLNRLVALGLESAMERAAPGAGEAEEGANRLVDLLEAEGRLLVEPVEFVAELESGPPLAALAGPHRAIRSDGYLSSHDESTLYVVVSPTNDDDSLPALRKFVGATREVSRRVIADEPGFKVALTGEPAMTVEEMNTVRRDTAFTSIVAIVGVSVLTFLVFRWRSHALIVLGTLVAGVVWSFGWVGLRYGYLNLVTSSFVSTLIGVGVAYGIHPVSEYELEGAHTVDPSRTVREAFRRTAAPVSVAAITTSAAFLSIQLMQFRGFAELGAVAGVGVLLCLIASLVTLPSVLAIYGPWRHRRDKEHRAAAVDRFWVERAATHVCRFPRSVVLGAALVTLLLAWTARNVGFRTDLLALLPRGSEALEWQERLVMESDLAPVSAVVAVDDLDGLQDIHRLGAEEPEILRVESALQFVPSDLDGSREAIGRLARLLDRIVLPDAPDPIDPDGLAASAWRLEEALAVAVDDAFAAGMSAVVGPLEEARAGAEEIAALAEGAGPEQVTAWNEAQRRLLDWTHRLLNDLRRATSVDPPTLENLPEPIRRRFRTSDGRLLAYLQPRGSVFDTVPLEGYVAACRRVSDEVFGFPIAFHRMAHRITSGFYTAVVVGALVVFLILLVDLRSLKDAGLAMVPLIIGVTWMLGWMGVLGLSFNFANLVAVPLIIGVGIDNGVHVVHRLRLEGAEGMGVVLRHTGRAILIASLTTMIGFGSVALASHRGLESLGLVLLLGVGSCLVTSTVVLPNLLVAFGKTGR